jgi:hypothetical protein
LHGLRDRDRIKQIADRNLYAGRQLAFFQLLANQYPDLRSPLDQFPDHCASNISCSANYQNLHSITFSSFCRLTF